MPYIIEWYIRPHILYNRLMGEITLEEIEQQALDSIRFLRQSGGLVHIIMDGTQIRNIPLNALKVRRAQSTLDQPNLGWLIIVTDNATVKLLGSLVSQMITRTRMHIMSSVDDALSFLEEQDQSIDWSQVEESVFH